MSNKTNQLYKTHTDRLCDCLFNVVCHDNVLLLFIRKNCVCWNAESNKQFKERRLTLYLLKFFRERNQFASDGNKFERNETTFHHQRTIYFILFFIKRITLPKKHKKVSNLFLMIFLFFVLSSPSPPHLKICSFFFTM